MFLLEDVIILEILAIKNKNFFLNLYILLGAMKGKHWQDFPEEKRTVGSGK